MSFNNPFNLIQEAIQRSSTFGASGVSSIFGPPETQDQLQGPVIEVTPDGEMQSIALWNWSYWDDGFWSS